MLYILIFSLIIICENGLQPGEFTRQVSPGLNAFETKLLYWHTASFEDDSNGAESSHQRTTWKENFFYLHFHIPWIIHATSPARMQGRRGEAVWTYCEPRITPQTGWNRRAEGQQE